MADINDTAAGQPVRKSLETTSVEAGSPPELNVIESDEMQELDLQDADDFGEVDLDDDKEEKKLEEEKEAMEKQMELPTSVSLRPPSPSSIEDKKKNNRRVTMAFRSTTPTPSNTSPVVSTDEPKFPEQRKELEKRPPVHVEPLEPVELEAISLEEDTRVRTTLRPEPKSGHEQSSPSMSDKLGLTTAFGYAASLLPSTSPSKTVEGLPNSAQTQNASAGPSRSSSYASLSPMQHDPASNTPAKASAPPVASGSWTSSFTNYFGSKSPSNSSPLPNIPSPFRKGARPAAPERTDCTGTAFLLHNLDATKEDRRASVEAGGSEALKEGFERVKRDSTRLREAAAYGDIGEFEEDDEDGPMIVGGRRKSSLKPQQQAQTRAPVHVEPVNYSDDQEPELGPDGVDWPFWGCVMNDYEAIARSRPRDLSRAIQQGIPAVVRGTIWQLMSSSKNVALEQTYAGFLKEKSPHEKSIQKDLARTLPGHRYFAQGGGVGQENLFNVVKAYSLCVYGLQSACRDENELMERETIGQV